ncbi:tyrosine-type recombinase/integrase [Microcoleus sp. B5-D4]|uniref:tyrosine-type recombinase/integrase n=1 Tax=unclassified Microcoleus TaxID=2642155 RepID=UPI002FD296AE
MYAKSQSIPETIKVQSDNGSLRLQFSTKYNPIFGGKRKHQGLGMKDTPDNWQKAIAIAYRIEGDLQHPDWQQLFDPSFAKYGLKTKYAAELKLAAPIPEPEPEMTVGAMWEDYLEWKQPQLQPTTFKFRFQISFTNILKGLVWDDKTKLFVDTHSGIWDLPLCPSLSESLFTGKMHPASKKNLLFALTEAFVRLQSQGKTKLNINPFIMPASIIKNKTDKYKSQVSADGTVDLRWWDKSDTETDPEERDRRAFTREERDIIIKAFYESDKPATRHAAPLVEFLFLTGCRSGEAFALEWKDVFLGRDKEYIRFNKSYNGKLKNTQTTKTGTIRLFKIYPKLNELLLRIKPDNTKPTDLVFVNTRGGAYNSGNLGILWNGKCETNKNGIESKKDGVLTRLVDVGKISFYLAPYHTRHTFITLMANAGTNLLLLATACGNSVEVIQRHYLGIDTTVNFPDI